MTLFFKKLVCLCFLVLSGGCLQVLAETNEKGSTATLPLSEILRLYKENTQIAKELTIVLPVQAAISKIEIDGRLLDNAMEIDITFQVGVLTKGNWVTIPLFEKDDITHITQLPPSKDIFIVEKDGMLAFIAKNEGIYDFKISMIKQATVDSTVKTVVLPFHSATKAEMVVHFDESLFQLSGGKTLSKPEGVLIFPEKNQFLVQWETKKGAIEPAKRVVTKPPVESLINVAHVSSVSTLEGELLTRIKYELQFEGAPSLTVDIPESYELKKVYLNGSAIPFEIKDPQFTLEALPFRAGGRSGTVELVLVRFQGIFNLSGSLVFSLPKVSWPIREMFMDVHLPAVFNYQYSGGSMATARHSKEVAFTYDLPTPGKTHSFHQVLITSSAPSVNLEYTIDLTGKYFVIKN